MQQRIREFIKRDFWYILLLMLAVLGCMYTMHQINNVTNACNQAWSEYIDTYCTCGMGYENLPNMNLSLGEWEIEKTN